MKKRFLSIILIICILFLGGCFSQTNKPKTYELDLSLLPNEIYQGELSLDDVRIKVTDETGVSYYISSTESMYLKEEYKLLASNKELTTTKIFFFSFFNNLLK